MFAMSALLFVVFPGGFLTIGWSLGTFCKDVVSVKMVNLMLPNPIILVLLRADPEANGAAQLQPA